VQKPTQIGFLLLIGSQTLHSIEEYSNSLWEVLPPARIISELISKDLSIGFAIVNATLVAFGFWCFFGPVLHGWRGASTLMWFWIALELGNSMGHTYLAIDQGGYFPGLYTMPLLAIFSVYTALKLVTSNGEANAT
jgi:hypothetical protein